MTVKEWLESLSSSHISTEADSTMMQNVLRRIGFPEAVVTTGIVYPEGHGQPVDIHSMAKVILQSQH